MPGAEPPAGRRTLAEKLNYLFQTAPPRLPGRREVTSREVAAAVRDAGYASISDTYIWQLRTGRADNPSLKHLEALAWFFGVPAAYFFDEEQAARVEAELELAGALRDNEVRQLALRAGDLSPEGVRAIRALVEYARRSEGIAAAGGPSEDATSPHGDSE